MESSTPSSPARSDLKRLFSTVRLALSSSAFIVSTASALSVSGRFESRPIQSRRLTSRLDGKVVSGASMTASSSFSRIF